MCITLNMLYNIYGLDMSSLSNVLTINLTNIEHDPDRFIIQYIYFDNMEIVTVCYIV